ncbi:hypothetical protein ALC57_01100 [Trachymyrmex cornetzi]|uniref:Helix-turn-helix domain-containing protein n=1 Tax=Trachymyrmex cornetzi TaxID=471704 RepID=A0A151JQC3_9HYME|nr:hypothetical protein ALC57_01100 [Trachymyrmex cornetzi]
MYKKLSCSESILPRAYALPKIHKLNCPFRLIILSIDSPLYALATFIHDITQGMEVTRYLLKGTRFEIEHVLLDVVSLFTNIPIDLTIESIDKKWNFVRDKINISKDEFMLGVRLVLNSTYFSFDGQFYKQNFGTLVGSPLSPIVSDLVLNSLHDRLKFILEFDDDKINFLDITIINPYRTIYNFYHKPTYSGRYLNFFSSHPLSQKRGIIIGMTDRAFKYHPKNFEHIISTLLKNDYPIDLIFNTSNARLKILIKSCDASYVRQTRRKLKIRLAEHRNHINRNNNNQSVITEHRTEFEHDFDWENVAILDEECFLNKRLISQCIHILMQQNSLNLRSDTEGVHQTYVQLLKDIK